MWKNDSTGKHYLILKDVYLFDKNAKNSKGKIISNLIDIKF